MKSSVVIISLITLGVFSARTQGAAFRETSDLSVVIVATKDDAGTPTIQRAGRFQVVVTNESDKSIRLWSDECQHGHDALSFQLEDDGRTFLMCERTPSPSASRDRPPKTITIARGETFTWNVGLADFFWGERMWKGAPEPNTGKLVTLTAVLEIKASDVAKEHGVWTGRVSSKPFKGLVVDPKLHTPNEYLWAQCPRQALAIMQADQSWITKQDDMQCTPLHHAARFGFVEVSRWLLTHGADVNAKAYNHFIPLHLTDSPEIVELLIAHKANINATTPSGDTALERAASRYAQLERVPEYAAERENARTIAKLLLEAGATYDIRSACLMDDLERVRVLVEADKKQARDKVAMRWAGTRGRVKIVKLLLEHGAEPEDADYGGLTFSYFSIEHADVLRLLFEAGADPKVRVEYRGDGSGPEGSTLLHQATDRGCLESAKLLLSSGLDVNLTDISGATPLHAASRSGHVPMVEFLLQNRADAKARTKEGWTPMSLAASQIRPRNDSDNEKFQAVIRRLERAGVELDVHAAIGCNDVQHIVKILQTDPKIGESRNQAGRPALHMAVALDRRDIVKLLLDKGSNPDIPSNEEFGRDGETALLKAAFWGRLEIAKLLIERGANVNAKAAGGVVPLHEAARLDHVDLARLLLEHGADVNAKDNKGKTPLDWARSYRERPEMTKLLLDHGGAE